MSVISIIALLAIVSLVIGYRKLLSNKNITGLRILSVVILLVAASLVIYIYVGFQTGNIFIPDTGPSPV